MPYFKKSEDFQFGENEFHGSGGPIKVEKIRATFKVLDLFKPVGSYRLPENYKSDIYKNILEAICWDYGHAEVAIYLLQFATLTKPQLSNLLFTVIKCLDKKTLPLLEMLIKKGEEGGANLKLDGSEFILSGGSTLLIYAIEWGDDNNAYRDDTVYKAIVVLVDKCLELIVI